MDDTGTRADGVNWHCQVICNPLYTAYFTTGLFWAQPLDSLHRLQQIGYAKQRPTRSHNDVGVYSSGIGAIGWNGTQHTVSIVEPYLSSPQFWRQLASSNSC